MCVCVHARVPLQQMVSLAHKADPEETFGEDSSAEKEKCLCQLEVASHCTVPFPSFCNGPDTICLLAVFFFVCR